MALTEDQEEGLIGRWVKSNFRAPWRGQVVSQSYGTTLIVKVMIDQYGRPIRKPFLTTISAGWLDFWSPMEELTWKRSK